MYTCQYCPKLLTILPQCYLIYTFSVVTVYAIIVYYILVTATFKSPLKLLQLSVTSGRALELLLETHKLFSFLLSDVKTRCLIQLKLKLSSANSNSTAVKCAEQKSSSVNYTQLDNDKDTQNLDGNGIVPTPSNRLLESVEDIVAAFVYCCNPYVVSGWCRLVNNLLQAFPELVGAYLQKYCVVASLTR